MKHITDQIDEITSNKSATLNYRDHCTGNGFGSGFTIECKILVVYMNFL